MYKIIRGYYNQDHPSQTIIAGLTLDEAQAYCRDPETSSSTCTAPEGVRHTAEFGDWFDGYEEI